MPPKRTSTSEVPAMTQVAIGKLVADSVTAALEAQAATIENADNTNRNTGEREALVARKLFSDSNCTEDCKVKFATGTLTEEGRIFESIMHQASFTEKVPSVPNDHAQVSSTSLFSAELISKSMPDSNTPPVKDGAVTAVDATPNLTSDDAILDKRATIKEPLLSFWSKYASDALKDNYISIGQMHSHNYRIPEPFRDQVRTNATSVGAMIENQESFDQESLSYEQGWIIDDFKKGACVGLYFINRPEWMVLDHACSAYSYVSVPLYDTLGPDVVKYIINHADIQAVFCVPTTLNISSVEDLVHTPSESDGISKGKFDLPVYDDFTPKKDEVLDDIISIPPRNGNDHFNAESSLIESVLNHDNEISSPKIDFHTEEFDGELALIAPNPPGIVEADLDPMEDIRFIENLMYDNSFPPRPPGSLKDDSETVIDSINDYFSSDDDSYENIDYVDASPPDSEIVSLEVVEIVSERCPGFEASRARGFVLRSLELQILSFILEIQYTNLID
ncbi:long chain acyl-CoA synthetase 6, peroxisomal-like protein [Tanacetum coccineum]|uniref:Long chain acyl-CoA synthetase 6, peroxisomal-like protein n=1 Tax=Tanacetum coccineum TaxID=301880 RepID=A0ABQ4WMU5_9ASTR